MNIWELHHALVHFAIALLFSGVALDRVGWWRGNETQMRLATWELDRHGLVHHARCKLWAVNVVINILCQRQVKSFNRRFSL